MKTISEH